MADYETLYYEMLAETEQAVIMLAETQHECAKLCEELKIPPYDGSRNDGESGGTV